MLTEKNSWFECQRRLEACLGLSRDMLAVLLRLPGYEVVAARDEVKGLQLIERERPDAAVVEIGLPERNGFEVAR